MKKEKVSVKQRFATRKLSIGLVSVLLGFSLVFGGTVKGTTNMIFAESTEKSNKVENKKVQKPEELGKEQKDEKVSELKEDNKVNKDIVAQKPENKDVKKEKSEKENAKKENVKNEEEVKKQDDKDKQLKEAAEKARGLIAKLEELREDTNNFEVLPGLSKTQFADQGEYGGYMKTYNGEAFKKYVEKFVVEKNLNELNKTIVTLEDTLKAGKIMLNHRFLDGLSKKYPENVKIKDLLQRLIQDVEGESLDGGNLSDLLNRSKQKLNEAEKEAIAEQDKINKAKEEKEKAEKEKAEKEKAEKEKEDKKQNKDENKEKQIDPKDKTDKKDENLPKEKKDEDKEKQVVPKEKMDKKEEKKSSEKKDDKKTPEMREEKENKKTTNKIMSRDGKVAVESENLDVNLKLVVNKLNKNDVEALNDKDADLFDIFFSLNENNETKMKNQPYKVTLEKRAEQTVEAVYFVNENGKLEQLDFSQDAKTVVFNVNHFSKYAVVYKTNKVVKEEKKQNMPKTAVASTGLLTTLLAGAGLFFASKRKNK